jgi:hypothetical protein
MTTIWTSARDKMSTFPITTPSISAWLRGSEDEKITPADTAVHYRWLRIDTPLKIAFDENGNPRLTLDGISPWPIAGKGTILTATPNGNAVEVDFALVPFRVGAPTSSAEECPGWNCFASDDRYLYVPVTDPNDATRSIWGRIPLETNW